jgi:hypothetical protein
MTTLVFGQNTGDTPGLTDTFIAQDAPTTTQDGSSGLEVSNFGATDRKNTILQFSVAALPSGLTVTAATIRLYLDVGDASGGSPRSMVIRRLLKQAVTAQATYNAFSTGNAWTTAGGENNADAVATPSASFDLSGLTGTGSYIDITSAGIAADIQGWKDGTFQNYGWIICRSDTSNDGHYAVFRASEAADGKRPQVSVVYTTGGGGGGGGFFFGRRGI